MCVLKVPVCVVVFRLVRDRCVLKVPMCVVVFRLVRDRCVC